MRARVASGAFLLLDRIGLVGGTVQVLRKRKRAAAGGHRHIHQRDNDDAPISGHHGEEGREERQGAAKPQR